MNKLQFVFKTFALSIFEWMFYTGFTVLVRLWPWKLGQLYPYKFGSNLLINSSHILHERKRHAEYSVYVCRIYTQNNMSPSPSNGRHNYCKKKTLQDGTHRKIRFQQFILYINNELMAVSRLIGFFTVTPLTSGSRNTWHWAGSLSLPARPISWT